MPPVILLMQGKEGFLLIVVLKEPEYVLRWRITSFPEYAGGIVCTLKNFTLNKYSSDIVLIRIVWLVHHFAWSWLVPYIQLILRASSPSYCSSSHLQVLWVCKFEGSQTCLTQIFRVTSAQGVTSVKCTQRASTCEIWAKKLNFCRGKHAGD